MKKAVILFLSIFILIACKEKEAQIPVYNVKKITSLNVEDLMIGLPTCIKYVDPYVLIVDLRADSVFYLINTKNNKIADACGREGNGPEEFSVIRSLMKGSENSFCFCDVNKRKVYEVKIEKENNRLIHVSPIFRFTKFLVFNIAPTNDDTIFIASGAYSPKVFSTISTKGEILKSYFDYPYRDEKEKKISYYLRSLIYSGNMANTADKTKMVKVSKRCDMVDFYKVQNNEPVLIKENLNSYPKYKIDPRHPKSGVGSDPEEPKWFTSVCCTNKRVYALYSGKSYRKYPETFELANYIYVYDWDGNLIKKLYSKVPLMYITVANGDKTMYAIAVNPDYDLVKIVLP